MKVKNVVVTNGDDHASILVQADVLIRALSRDKNVWFPLFNDYETVEAKQLYIRSRLKILARNQYKKRVAKKIIKLKPQRIAFCAEYTRLAFNCLGMIMGDHILDTMNRPSLARRLFLPQKEAAQ